jgi:hypothetical protein
MVTTTQTAVGADEPFDKSHRRVIFASSLGTVFEWYDFYLYGSLSVIIAKHFFSGVNETTGFIFALLAFAAGFFVRPFGALFLRQAWRSHRSQVHVLGHDRHHGRIDRVGRSVAKLRFDRRHSADHPYHPEIAARFSARR